MYEDQVWKVDLGASLRLGAKDLHLWRIVQKFLSWKKTVQQ